MCAMLEMSIGNSQAGETLYLICPKALRSPSYYVAFDVLLCWNLSVAPLYFTMWFAGGVGVSYEQWPVGARIVSRQQNGQQVLHQRAEQVRQQSHLRHDSYKKCVYNSIQAVIGEEMSAFDCILMICFKQVKCAAVTRKLYHLFCLI